MTTETLMPYATKPIPWLHKGKDVTGAPTTSEAIKLAGLDWNVDLEPIFDQNGREIPKFQATIRSTDRYVLGIVGRNYRTIQNRQAFDFLDGLLKDDQLQIAGCGSFDDGITVWLQAYMPEGTTINDDEYKRFLVAKTSHDGTAALSTHSGNLRVICRNTLAMATRVQALVRIGHTGNIEEKLIIAQETIKVASAQQARFEEWLRKLGTVKVSDSDVETVRDEMFGPLDEATPTRRRSAIEDFLDVYSAERQHSGQNAYALANAVTGFADHYVKTKEGIDRLSSVLTGHAYNTKMRGLSVVQEVVGVKL